MDKEAFLKHARESGFDEDQVADFLKLKDDSLKDGITIPYEMLIPFPVPIVEDVS